VRVDFDAPRCEGCGLKFMHCLCAELPLLRSRTRFVLVRHRQERFKTSNTGRLLARCLPETAVADWSGRGEPWAPPTLPPGAVLLFPGEDALPPSALATSAPITVVLIDGTWKQSRKMARMVPGLSALPRVALPATRAPEMVLRRRVVPHGLCTIEAAAALLLALGEEEAGEGLLTAWRLQVRRILESKGQDPDQRGAKLAASGRALWRSTDTETDTESGSG